jgi:hypothetical protein
MLWRPGRVLAEDGHSKGVLGDDQTIDLNALTTARSMSINGVECIATPLASSQSARPLQPKRQNARHLHDQPQRRPSCAEEGVAVPSPGLSGRVRNISCANLLILHRHRHRFTRRAAHAVGGRHGDFVAAGGEIGDDELRPGAEGTIPI